MRKLCLRALAIFMLVAFALTGCKSKDKAKEPTSEVKEEQAVEKDSSEIEGLHFVSADERLSFELPDDTWECTEDSESQITFTSDNGVINITHVEGEDIAHMQIPESKESYESMIKGNFAEVECQIDEFELLEENGRKGYKAVVSYQDGGPDKYMVGFGTYTESEGYTVAATLTSEDTAILEMVKESVFGIIVQ